MKWNDKDCKTNYLIVCEIDQPGENAELEFLFAVIGRYNITSIAMKTIKFQNINLLHLRQILVVTDNILMVKNLLL